MGPSELFRAAMGDPTTQARLPRLSGDEVDSIARVLTPVVSNVDRWANGYTDIVLRSAAIGPAMLLRLEFPDLPEDRLATLVKLVVWIFGVDDLVDTPAAYTEVASSVRACYLAAAAPECIRGSDDPYIQSFLPIMGEISRWQLYPQMRGIWGMAFARLIDGIVIQGKLARQLREGPFALDVEEYLLLMNHSVGFPLLTVTGLMAGSEERVLGYLQQMFPLIESCAMIVRLANDLRSFRKEQEESGVNSLMLAPFRDAAPGGAQAVELLENRIAEEALAARRLLPSLKDCAPIGERIIRAAEFAYDLYTRFDFRVFRGLSSWLPGSA